VTIFRRIMCSRTLHTSTQHNTTQHTHTHTHNRNQQSVCSTSWKIDHVLVSIAIHVGRCIKSICTEEKSLTRKKRSYENRYNIYKVVVTSKYTDTKRIVYFTDRNKIYSNECRI